MLCRYLAWNLIVGAAVMLALAELLSPSEPVGGEPEKPSTAPHGWYAPLPDIPECYLRNVPCEPCPTAVREAEHVVRSRP